MNPKFLSILFLPTFLMCQIDTTHLFSYYPIAIGNTWEYQAQSSNSHHIISIEGDTTINGYMYFRKSYPNDQYQYLRLDTASLELLNFVPQSESEYLLFDFNPIIGSEYPQGYFMGDSLISTIAGERIAHYYHMDYYPLFESKTFFAAGLGEVEYWSYDYRDGREEYDALNACIIDGIQYGIFFPVSVDAEFQLLTSNEITVFPNPTNGSLSIQGPFKMKGYTSIAIYDIAGQKKYSIQNTSNASIGSEIILNSTVLNNFSSGVYFISVSTETKTMYQRFTLVK